MLTFVELDDTEYEKAYDLSKRALYLSDNFINLQMEASKLSSVDATKGEMQKLFYQKYRTLQNIHEFTRMLHNRGERDNRVFAKIN
jgi:hypothetical protein